MRADDPGSLTGLLTSEQETIPSWTDAADEAPENSSVKANSDSNDENAAMAELLASIERELLKLYRDKEAIKTMKSLFENARRDFDRLSLWDRIFFKL